MNIENDNLSDFIEFVGDEFQSIVNGVSTIPIQTNRQSDYDHDLNVLYDQFWLLR